MGNAARKARKAAGQPFVPKPEKVPTAVPYRSSVQNAAGQEVRRLIRKLNAQGVSAAEITPELVRAEYEKEQESK